MLRAVLVGVFIACSKYIPSHSDSATTTRPGLPSVQKEILDAIPRDIQTAISRLKLQPDIVRYATCPSCCQIYPPNPSTPGDPYPHHCSHSETDKPVCGASLVRRVLSLPTGDNKAPK